MPLSTDRAAQKECDAREIVAMAFRDDHTAEKVTISNLSFEGCSVASAAKFAVQERLRLHLRGHGGDPLAQHPADPIEAVDGVAHKHAAAGDIAIAIPRLPGHEAAASSVETAIAQSFPSRSTTAAHMYLP